MTDSNHTTDDNPKIDTKAKVFLEGQMLSARFGSMVTILMQSPEYFAMPLKDLKDRFVPPLQLNLYRLAEAQNQETGETAPVALILWAAVSNDLHETLSNQPSHPIILKNQEWRSGDNYWIVDAVGPKKFLTPLLSAIRENELSDKNVYYRAMSENGPIIKSFDANASNVDPS